MKLYRFDYSPYARKVQILLELLGLKHEVIDVSYSDRTELATLTGGYIYVPVLVGDDGAVTVESRLICEKLLVGAAKQALVPSPFEGPIWAYADFADGPLEDVLFRIASPALHHRFRDPGERALFNLVKERKFGAGCVDQWLQNREVLIERGARLLAPSLATLEQTPFLFGAHPTLADAALYGLLAMLERAEPALLTRLAPGLVSYKERVEAARP
ncbi:MAG TPA: glutathione S-transferase family protein [Polyangiaceae bacterium]|nr:glutathione S-transferase family protein [Polyangiaceae bacterium]